MALNSKQMKDKFFQISKLYRGIVCFIIIRMQRNISHVMQMKQELSVNRRKKNFSNPGENIEYFLHYFAIIWWIYQVGNHTNKVQNSHFMFFCKPSLELPEIPIRAGFSRFLCLNSISRSRFQIPNFFNTKVIFVAVI